MQRRDLFRVFAAAGAVLGLSRAQAASPEGKPKVVYHLSDADKAAFVLGNIKNHYEGTGGDVEIVLVVHGPALSQFKQAGASAALAARFESLVEQGLQPQACGNTMQGMDVSLGDLLSGFVRIDEGGVVRLAELQRQGYAYLRP